LAPEAIASKRAAERHHNNFLFCIWPMSHARFSAFSEHCPLVIWGNDARPHDSKIELPARQKNL
jgi:hypothetical protein